MSRNVPASMTTAWKSQGKIGAQKPVVRATIQVQRQKLFPYDTAYMNGGSFSSSSDHHRGYYTSMFFGEPSWPKELRNIQSCSWNRSLEQDVATCTITLLNSDPTPIGNSTEVSAADDWEQQGVMTYNRGLTKLNGGVTGSNPWGYAGDAGWKNMIVPDRVVKTYEGYGADYSVDACDDPNLVQTGVWLIDDVQYTAEGVIVISMRDIGRLLLDQICFPPVVPYAQYPLSWVKVHTAAVKGRAPTGGAWLGQLQKYGRAISSNRAYIGQGLTDPPYKAYVNSVGGWNGHAESDALRAGDGYQYWVSTGQSSRHSFVWWEYDLYKAKPVSAVRLKCYRGPYVVYISVHNGTKWLGTKTIPYKVTTEGINNGAKIRYMKAAIVDRQSGVAAVNDIVLPRKVRNAKKIRITFTRLSNNIVGNYPWRAGLLDMKIYTGNYADLGFHKGDILKVVGNYVDYADIVQVACAWAGWYWPKSSLGVHYMRRRTYPGSADFIRQQYNSLQLTDGRVWGQIHGTLTAGLADLTVEQFDKKPLMDMINYVRDLTGFRFHIDELGRAVFRMPNLWSTTGLGNYVTPQSVTDLDNHLWWGRTTSIVTIDERETLLDYATQLDSKNIRERIFVANVTGKVGTVIRGFNPYPVGMRRYSGWTDQHFATKQECRVMADFINARQMFSWKKAEATIPGYPKIQVDDQIRIYERVTNETFYHYVLGIESSLDMNSGEYIYKLQTHWLGERPQDAWAVKVEELAGVTQAYLRELRDPTNGNY